MTDLLKSFVMMNREITELKANIVERIIIHLLLVFGTVSVITICTYLIYLLIEVIRLWL